MLARTSYLCNKRLVSFLQAIQARSDGTHTIHTAPHRIHRSLTETHKAHTGSHTSVICLLVACNDLDIQTKKDFFFFCYDTHGHIHGQGIGVSGYQVGNPYSRAGSRVDRQQSISQGNLIVSLLVTKSTVTIPVSLFTLFTLPATIAFVSMICSSFSMTCCPINIFMCPPVFQLLMVRMSQTNRAKQAVRHRAMVIAAP